MLRFKFLISRAGTSCSASIQRFTVFYHWALLIGMRWKSLDDGISFYHIPANNQVFFCQEVRECFRWLMLKAPQIFSDFIEESSSKDEE